MVSTMASGSHDHSQKSHNSSKISIPASELTWKKSPGISGTHMLVFKCRPLKTHLPKPTVDETPAMFQPDLKLSQQNHDKEAVLSSVSNGCNGIDNDDNDSIVTETPPENCFVKKGTNGVSLHDNHRSTLNGCTNAFAHVNKKTYPSNDKEAESYKLFRSIKKNYHQKKKNKRRTALDILIEESRQFRNNKQVISEDESSRDSFADDSTMDEDDEIEFNNFMVDHSYAKTTNGEWEPPAKRPRMMTELGTPEMIRGVCSAELVVFDSRNKCLLQDGQYELVLQDCDMPSSPTLGSPLSWDTIFGNNSLVSALLSLGMKYSLYL